MHIRPERPEDSPGIRHVNQTAFETAVEADLVDVLRQQARPIVSLVAVDGEVVVGHLLFSPVTLSSHPEIHDIVARYVEIALRRSDWHRRHAFGELRPLLPIVIEGVQEQQQGRREQRARIQKQEDRITALERARVQRCRRILSGDLGHGTTLGLFVVAASVLLRRRNRNAA